MPVSYNVYLYVVLIIPTSAHWKQCAVLGYDYGVSLINKEYKMTTDSYLIERRRPMLTVVVYPRKASTSLLREKHGPFTVKIHYFINNKSITRTFVNVSYDDMRSISNHPRYKMGYVNESGRGMFKRVWYVTHCCGVTKDQRGAAAWVEDFLKTHLLEEV